LLQTEDYARALLQTLPGASADVVDSRLRSRMERQRRVLLRDDPPQAWFVVDEHSLYCVETASGSGAVLVRDTTNRSGVALSVPASAWTAFLSTLR
jgi:hypothetical protein